MINDAQLKKILETLFGFGSNSSRAKMLSKIKPGSGSAPGWMVIANAVRHATYIFTTNLRRTERAYGVFAAPSFGKI